MVQDLGRFLAENHIIINDPDTWDELTTFVYHANGKTGALKGCYDDRATALMIALQGFLKRRPGTFLGNNPITRDDKGADRFTGY